MKNFISQFLRIFQQQTLNFRPHLRSRLQILPNHHKNEDNIDPNSMKIATYSQFL